MKSRQNKTQILILVTKTQNLKNQKKKKKKKSERKKKSIRNYLNQDKKFQNNKKVQKHS